MRQVLIISVVLAGLAASVQPGRAGPFCLATDLYDGGDDCRYNTWAECRRSQPGQKRIFGQYESRDSNSRERDSGHDGTCTEHGSHGGTT